MKIDRENSIKNIYVEDLDLIEEQIERIETSNGRLTLTSAAASFGMFTGILNTISNVAATDLNVALGILNVVIIMLSGLVLDRSVVKLTNNNITKKELQIKRDNIVQKLEKDELLEIQFKELNKVLCKKNNIVYFPQK